MVTPSEPSKDTFEGGAAVHMTVHGKYKVKEFVLISKLVNNGTKDEVVGNLFFITTSNGMYLNYKLVLFRVFGMNLYIIELYVAIKG